MDKSRATLIGVLLIVIAAMYFESMSRGNPVSVYQEVSSEDGRCVCRIVEYDDPKDDVGRILDLQIILDGVSVLARTYFGNKCWEGTKVQFAVGLVGPNYFLYIVGHSDRAVAAIDRETGSVWFNSSDEMSRPLFQTFDSDPEKPKLTDLNSLIAFELNELQER